MERRRNRPERISRAVSAFALASSVVLTGSACSNEPECGGTFEVEKDVDSLGTYSKFTTKEGKVQIAYNVRNGKLVHVYFEKNDTINKELNKEELRAGHAEVPLLQSVLNVDIKTDEIVVTCV